MTKDEFIAGYCARSKITPRELLAWRKAVPCACGDVTCGGWAMLPIDCEGLDLWMETDLWPEQFA